jgi:Fe-Mn family superoxide dismutase
MMDIRQTIDLVEAKSKKTLELARLPYSKTSLGPVLSQRSLDHHFSGLAKGYVDRYNAGEGDPAFNEAGAYLHNIYFPQFESPRAANKPHGPSLSLIDRKYGNFNSFKEEFTKKAMSIQGSGWIYMARSGEIKTIKNHAIRSDIALLVDWWEHAWFDDYGTNKSKYLSNIWRIINWNSVNSRL